VVDDDLPESRRCLNRQLAQGRIEFNIQPMADSSVKQGAGRNRALQHLLQTDCLRA